jgi:molybdopterin-guanine dinucleotide biosynthesis protein A
LRSLILAGGKSTRMGSDKCLLQVDGVACIQRVAMTLAEAGLEPIRISVASPEHMERYGRVLDSSLQVEWVVDSNPHAGPIEAILDALADPFCNDPLQIAPVDVPWLEMEILIDLERRIGDCKVAIPVCSGRTHPLLALVRPEVAGLVGRNRRPLREQFHEMDHVLVEVSEEVVRNVNRPSDLE